MFPPRETETNECYQITDTFCEALVRIERVGPCFRLVFFVSERAGPQNSIRSVVVVARLVLPALFELAQMAAGHAHDLDAAFASGSPSAYAN